MLVVTSSATLDTSAEHLNLQNTAVKIQKTITTSMHCPYGNATSEHACRTPKGPVALLPVPYAIQKRGHSKLARRADSLKCELLAWTDGHNSGLPD
jgi:hypothetical protein